MWIQSTRNNLSGGNPILKIIDSTAFKVVCLALSIILVGGALSLHFFHINAIVTLSCAVGGGILFLSTALAIMANRETGSASSSIVQISTFSNQSAEPQNSLHNEITRDEVERHTEPCETEATSLLEGLSDSSERHLSQISIDPPLLTEMGPADSSLAFSFPSEDEVERHTEPCETEATSLLEGLSDSSERHLSQISIDPPLLTEMEPADPSLAFSFPSEDAPSIFQQENVNQEISEEILPTPMQNGNAHLPLHTGEEDLIRMRGVLSSLPVITDYMQVFNYDIYNPFLLKSEVPLTGIPRIYEGFNGRSAAGECIILVIVVNEEDIKVNPALHLNLFINQIPVLLERMEEGEGFFTDAILRVKFFDCQGKARLGFDAGGVSREYLNLLMTSLIQEGHLFTRNSRSGLFYPFARQREDFEICKNLGILMGFCLNKYSLGIHFDHSVFAALLNGFEFSDISKEYEELSFKAKCKVMKTFYEVQEGSDDLEVISIMQKEPIPEWTPGDLKKILQFAQLLSIEIEGVDTVERQFLDRLGSVEELLLDALTDEECAMILSTYPSIVEKICHEIFKEKFDCIAKSLHSLTKGFSSMVFKEENLFLRRRSKLLYAWNQLRNRYRNDSQSLMMSIQGILDAATIAESIVCKAPSNPELLKKTSWLQEWLKNKATSEEIRDFLIFSTGGSSLSSGDSISIDTQKEHSLGKEEDGSDRKGYSPSPVSSTCTKTLLFSPQPCEGGGYDDFTEEGFIASLKAVISGTGFSTL